MSIYKIIKDIRNLRGAEVEIFGQKTTLDAEVGDEYIDVLEVLENLKNNEVGQLYIGKYNEEEDEYEDEEATDEEWIEFYEYEVGELREIEHNNTYNWGANISNDIDFRILEGFGKYFIELKVHRFGDVRANYTEIALLEFDDEFDFLEALGETNKYIKLKDGKEALVSVTHEGYDIFDNEGKYIETVYELEDYL